MEPEDPIAWKAVEIVHTMGLALTSGAFPAIERFPWLRIMPSWFPGCDFKRVAEQGSRAVKEMDSALFDMAMNNSASILCGNRKCLSHPDVLSRTREREPP